MTQTATPWMPLAPLTVFPPVGSRNLSASTHWCGGKFVAPLTGTIDTIYVSTATVSSPVFDIECAITELDANGYPLGSDVAVSSAQGSLAANTHYALSISASVTAGTTYGIICRIKSGTYSSGSANIRNTINSAWWTGGSYIHNHLVETYNLGANTKGTSWCGLTFKYSTGFAMAPGVLPVPNASISNITTGTSSGNCGGNKFTLLEPVTLVGYLGFIDADDGTIALFAGSDNTVLTNSSVDVNESYRQTTSEGGIEAILATPLLVQPGTYRVAVKNNSTTANAVRGFNASFATAGVQEMFGLGGGNWMRTSYASGAWTDDTTGLVMLTPLVCKVANDAPVPQAMVGVY